MRAVRADKLTYAALEATLALWAQAPARSRIPAYRMLTMTVDEIERRAQALAARLDGHRRPHLPRHRRRLDDRRRRRAGLGLADEARGRERRATSHPMSWIAGCARTRPPVVARIQDDRVVLDLRTVPEDDEAALAEAIRASAQRINAAESDASLSKSPGKTPR